MNKKIKFLIAICLGFGVGFLFDNNFAFSNSLKIKFHCDINVDQNTNNSDIKDSVPKKIEISYFLIILLVKTKNIYIFQTRKELLKKFIKKIDI